MRIGLIAVDGRNGFPNLALMRLSNWHKRRGDTVEWWTGFTHYDRVYASNWDTAYNLVGKPLPPAADCRNLCSPYRL